MSVENGTRTSENKWTSLAQTRGTKSVGRQYHELTETE